MVFLANGISSDISFIVISSTILVVLLILSALISGSEVAFFSMTPSEIEECKEDDSRRSQLIISLIKAPKQLLAAILICNNLVNVGFVTIGTFLSWEILKTQEGWKMLVATVIMTFLIVFFGEVIPKVYANQKSLSFARRTAFLLNIINKLFKPFSRILTTMSGVVENRIEKKGYNASIDEVHEALEITTGEEATEEEKEILKGIVNFSTMHVKQIMKSRLDITAVDVKMDFHELMDKINKSGYSRIPVFRETIDKIVGILYVKDLLPFIEQDEHFKWQKLLRDVYFVPESKKIDDLLKKFQEKRVHMAIVVDEYAGTSGLITMEDIIEEIFGEINDEFDDDDIEYTKIDERTFVFEGKTALTDVIKILDSKPDIFDEVKGESESLGGLILEIHHSMPHAGELIEFEHFEFKIESVSNKRIKKIRVKINEKKSEEKLA